MSDALVRYDEACRAIAAAMAVDEVLDISAKAEALRAYARMANNRGMEIDAAEIRFRAERRLGEMLAAEKAAGGMASGTRGQLRGRGIIGGSDEEPPMAAPTLAELGVDKKLSSRAQQLAAVPVAKFEGMIGGWRNRVAVETQRVTTSLLKEGARAQEREAFAARTVGGCDVDDLVGLAASGRRYRLMLLDVPWEYVTYSELGQDRGASRHYATQSIAEIMAMPVAPLAAEECLLAFWTSGPFLESALAIVKHYGFTYKTIGFDWLKTHADGAPAMGGGHWTRATNEICLFATRGHPTRLDAGVLQGLASPRGEHSVKPDEFHDRLERLVGGPYLELYARRPHAGWTTWGNEISKRAFAEALATGGEAGTDARATADACGTDDDGAGGGKRRLKYSDDDIERVRAAAAPRRLTASEIAERVGLTRGEVKGVARWNGISLLTKAEGLARKRAQTRALAGAANAGGAHG